MQFKEKYVHWLENFNSEEEIFYANKLFSSMQLIKNDTLFNEIREIIFKHIVESDFQKILVLPVRKPSINQTPRRRFLRPISNDSSALTAFHNFNPLEEISIEDAGSYASIANLIRDVREKYKGNYPTSKSIFLSHQEISQYTKNGVFNFSSFLKEYEELQIIAVADCSISGDEVLEYINTFLNNRVINKQIRDENVEIDLCVGAISRSAHEKLNGKFNNITHCFYAKTFKDTDWTDKDRKIIERLCQKYSTDQFPALGYEESGNLFFTDHRIPDNTPGILIRSNDKNWKPLFNTRRDYQNHSDLLEVIENSRVYYDARFEPEIYKNIYKVRNQNHRNLLLILAAANRRTLQLNQIPTLENFSYEQTENLIEKYILEGLLEKTDSANSTAQYISLTDFGLSILSDFSNGKNRWKEKFNTPKRNIENKHDFYYPKSYVDRGWGV